MPAAVLPRRVLAAHRPVLHGGRDRRHRSRPAQRHRGTALPRPRLLPRRRRVRLHLAGRRPGTGPADRPRRAPRGADGGPGRRAVQSRRRPGQGHLPGHRHPRPGLPRPPRPAHRRVGHRRLQRPLRAPALRRRVHLRRGRRTERPRCAVRRGGAAVVPGPGAVRAHLVHRPRSAPLPTRPGAGRPPRQRDRRRRDGRRRGPAPLRRVRGVVDVRGPRRGAAGARLPPGGARLLRTCAVRRLPRHDRHRRPRLGRRRHRRRRLRHRAAAADDPLRRPAPAGRRANSTEGAVGPTEAARYLYGAAIVLVLLYAPDGLHGLVRRARDRLRRRRTPTTAPHTAVPSPPPPAAAARPKEHTP